MAQPDSAELKLMRSTKFPPTFTRKVDVRKVNMEVMKKWMAQRITELLGMEDDVTVDFAFELVNEKTGANFNPNIKLLQIKMQGFLGEKSAADFCNELWDLMLSAQESSLGVPTQLLEAKKAELMQERQAAEKRAQEEKRRRERDAARDREMDERRRRDRRDRDDRQQRDRDRDYYSSRGGRRHSPRPRSRSPRRRRDYDEGRDTYKRRDRSRSRTPPRRIERRRDDSPPIHRRDRNSSTPPRKRHRGDSSSAEPTDSAPKRRERERSTGSPAARGSKRRNTSSPASGD